MDKRTARAQRTSAEAVRADALGVMAAVRAAMTATDRLAVAGVADTDDLAAEAVAAILSGVATTYGEALGAAVATLRDSRAGVATDGDGDSDAGRAVSVYLSAEVGGDDGEGDTFGDMLADDATPWLGRDLARRFADGGRFAVAYTADGWDTDGATYTDGDGATLRGGDAIRAARSAALLESTDDAHGAAAAARGAKNQAASVDRDAEVAAALRVVGQAKGYAAAVALHLGWITADSTPEQRADAMNRVRVAVSRLKRRTSGDSHSARD
jgi:hypothetical protein